MASKRPADAARRPTFPVRLDVIRPTSPPISIRPVPSSGRFAGVPHRPNGLGLDSAAIRQNMVKRLAEQGVTNPRVLHAMSTVERHRFVDTALASQAYEDTSLPIGLGQTISKPGIVARMLELLCQGADGRLGRVLEIGTGCGYQAALLGMLATEVYTVERLRGLHTKARTHLRPMNLPQIHLVLGDGMVGYAAGAPYAGIIAAAGGDAIPQAWIDQLAVGARLVAPVVSQGLDQPSQPSHPRSRQVLVVIDKTARGCHQTVMDAVQFVPLRPGVA